MSIYLVVIIKISRKSYYLLVENCGIVLNILGKMIISICIFTVLFLENSICNVHRIYKKNRYTAFFHHPKNFDRQNYDFFSICLKWKKMRWIEPWKILHGTSSLQKYVLLAFFSIRLKFIKICRSIIILFYIIIDILYLIQPYYGINLLFDETILL